MKKYIELLDQKMNPRYSRVQHETLGVVEPIQHLFSSFDSPPRYTIMDAMSDVFSFYLTGEIDIDASELEGLLTTCQEYAVDKKDSGEPTDLLQSEIAIIALYTAAFAQEENSIKKW